MAERLPAFSSGVALSAMQALDSAVSRSFWGCHFCDGTCPGLRRPPVEGSPECWPTPWDQRSQAASAAFTAPLERGVTSLSSCL